LASGANKTDLAYIEGGGSLRYVQQLAGHSGLATTQRYIEGSSDAKRRIVDLIS
jgi:integrase/recombinase XerD